MTIPPDRCLFSGKPLDGSSEHLVISAIGGKVESTEVICEEVNSWAGRVLDTAITEKYRLVMNFLAPLLPGSARSKDVRVEVAVPAENGQWELGPGAQPELKKVNVLERDARGRPVLVVTPSFEKVEGMLQNLGVRIEDCSVQWTVDRLAGPAFRDALVYTPILARGVLRMIMDVVDYVCRKEQLPLILREQAFDQARDYVFQGKEESGLLLDADKLLLMPDALFAVRQMIANGGLPLNRMNHGIAFRANPETGEAVAAMVLFDHEPYLFVMSRSYDGPPIELVTRTSILDGEQGLESARVTDLPLNIAFVQEHRLKSTSRIAHKEHFQRLISHLEKLISKAYFFAEVRRPEAGVKNLLLHVAHRKYSGDQRSYEDLFWMQLEQRVRATFKEVGEEFNREWPNMVKEYRDQGTPQFPAVSPKDLAELTETDAAFLSAQQVYVQLLERSRYHLGDPVITV